MACTYGPKSELISPRRGKGEMIEGILEVSHSDVEGLSRFQFNSPEGIPSAQTNRAGVSKVAVAPTGIDDQSKTTVPFQHKEHFNILDTIVGQRVLDHAT